MGFKFYTKEDNRSYLYCMHDDKLYWFIAPWSEDAYWFQCDKVKEDLIEITESEAQEICSGRIYSADVWIPKKKKGVKIYSSLFDVPNPQTNKIILFSIVLAIIVFGIFFLIALVDGKPEIFLPFLLAMIIFVVLSIIAEKITGLEGEGGVIVIFVGIIIYILSRVL